MREGIDYLHSLRDNVLDSFFRQNSIGKIIADIISCYSQGMKVVVEIVVIAAENRLISDN